MSPATRARTSSIQRSLTIIRLALVKKGDFDAAYGERIKAIAQKIGAEAIHANELGLGRLEEIADDLYALLKASNAYFFVSRVEKAYLLATKMFDVLFDSGENAAVAWHNYNFRPLKIMLAFKLAAVIDDEIAREFWKCLLLPSEEASREKCCRRSVKRSKPGSPSCPTNDRARVLGDGLDWIIKHPELGPPRH